MKIIICSNTAWNVFNFRSSLIMVLKARGHEVVAVAPTDDFDTKIESLGVRFIDLFMDNKGTNPLRDFILFIKFFRLFRKERPDIYLSYTIKPNVYGSLAARMLGVKSICNVSGLGTAFIRESFLTKVIEVLYRISVGNADVVFFQNEADKELFLSRHLLNHTRIRVIPGSGVDTNYFSPQKRTALEIKQSKNSITFLLVARLLRDKGVGEFVEAARVIKKRYTNVKFQLLGFLDVINRTAVLKSEVESWEKEGLVEYLGSSNEVRKFYNNADCIVLPSYREGLSKTLIEAASMAKPIITTDVPGCRDVIEDGLTGFLCKPQDSNDLGRQIEKMIKLSQSKRIKMGLLGRKKALNEFDEKIVIQYYLDAIHTLAIPS